MAPAVILYDGVCGFCNRTVRFVLQRDRDARFRFAPLQSAYAEKVLARHGRDAQDLDTVSLVLNPDSATERVHVKSDAVCAIFDRLGGVWRIAALTAGCRAESATAVTTPSYAAAIGGSAASTNARSRRRSCAPDSPRPASQIPLFTAENTANTAWRLDPNGAFW